MIVLIPAVRARRYSCRTSPATSGRRRPASRRLVRTIGVGAQILLDLGVKTWCCLTNSPPDKNVVALDGYGLNVVGTHRIRGAGDMSRKGPRSGSDH